MASQQPQQPLRRPAPSQRAQDEPHQQARRSDSQAPSTTSVDSQTLFLNSPSSSSPLAATQEDPLPSTAKQSVALHTTSTHQTDDEPRKCWICFSDETEDTPQSSVWRSPCPCVLTAHESCLLDWIADIESPDASRTTAPPAEIRCPQCKTQIHLTRPRSHLLEAVGKLEKYASKLLLPGIAAGTLYTLLLAFSHHGAHTIRTIFDEHDAEAILATRTIRDMNWLEREAYTRFPGVFKPFFRGWRGLRVEIGLPLIPAALVASRSTIADAVLPILPVIFFATHSPSSKTLSLEYWPPSAALTLVTLPYIRSAYDEYLERTWGELERGWIKEVKPRAGEGENEGSQAGGNHDGDADGFEVDFELELDIGGGGHEEDEEEQEDEIIEDQFQHNRRARVADHQRDVDNAGELAHLAHEVNEAPWAFGDPEDYHRDRLAAEHAELEEFRRGFDRRPEGGEDGPEVRIPGDDLLEAVEIAAAAEEAEAEARRRNNDDNINANANANNVNANNNINVDNGNDIGNGNQEHRVDLLSTAHTVADTVFGALLFPMIAEGSGELLRLLLPRSWTLAPRKGRWGIPTPTGLLQTKWGRSIVGGCLFVVLKDAVRIYCRWRMAVIFRERRVRDYDKKAGKLF